MSLQGSLSIERMCQMVPVSRRSFYRSLKEQQPVEEEMICRRGRGGKPRNNSRRFSVCSRTTGNSNVTRLGKGRPTAHCGFLAKFADNQRTGLFAVTVMFYRYRTTSLFPGSDHEVANIPSLVVALPG